MEPLTSDFILIVDDNPANLAVLTRTLKGIGCAVRVAVDGESALQQVAEEQPALILLDIMMSGIDGFETCRRLKENPLTCEVPVIFMTALSDIDHKVEGLSLGAIDYVTKPFNENEVRARVRTHLKVQNLLHTVTEQNHQLKLEIAQRQAAERNLQKLNRELQQAQIRLLQQEKLSSIGELVTGIVHEISNPVGCIAGNIEFVQEYADKLLEHFALYQERFPHDDQIIQQHAERVELDYVIQDLPAVVNSMQTSTDRIVAISKFLKIFSRFEIQRDQKYVFDLHELIDGALLILKHRLKAHTHRAAIAVTRTYGDLPKTPCFPGQLNQALTNVLTFLIDRFDEGYPRSTLADFGRPQEGAQVSHPLHIQIKTTLDGDHVRLWIGGNVGQPLLAEPLSTAPVQEADASDLDLGLAIARQIIVSAHGGEFSYVVSSSETEFTVLLPTR
jgi:DNA-binding response OmpR family regulator